MEALKLAFDRIQFYFESQNIKFQLKEQEIEILKLKLLELQFYQNIDLAVHDKNDNPIEQQSAKIQKQIEQLKEINQKQTRELIEAKINESILQSNMKKYQFLSLENNQRQISQETENIIEMFKHQLQPSEISTQQEINTQQQFSYAEAIAKMKQNKEQNINFECFLDEQINKQQQSFKSICEQHLQTTLNNIKVYKSVNSKDEKINHETGQFEQQQSEQNQKMYEINLSEMYEHLVNEFNKLLAVKTQQLSFESSIDQFNQDGSLDKAFTKHLINQFEQKLYANKQLYDSQLQQIQQQNQSLIQQYQKQLKDCSQQFIQHQQQLQDYSQQLQECQQQLYSCKNEKQNIQVQAEQYSINLQYQTQCQQQLTNEISRITTEFNNKIYVQAEAENIEQIRQQQDIEIEIDLDISEEK
ncbi:Hypothetical_protein [Hexamita inflata]|uniref:Hypothetical_protein n=1 Tax=Hexamita inflata TaxID=28002 RepID=A0AA86TE87_9EUKA|nr:Hypothetical protein HINF_LOCUS2940 [Hexamita inflata]